MTGPIELVHWNPDPKREGYVIPSPRKVSDILRELNERLDADGLRPDEYGFDQSLVQRNSDWPTDFRWVACYAVTGGSEGHYIHVDIIIQSPGKPDERRPMSLGKTFQGMDFALKVASACAEHLGA